jgi:hypothetical protein
VIRKQKIVTLRRMIACFGNLRRASRLLSSLIAVIFLTGSLFAGGGGGDSRVVKPSGKFSFHEIVCQNAPGTGASNETLAKVFITCYSATPFPAILSTAKTPLLKIFVFSGYERNPFYFLTTINAP